MAVLARDLNCQERRRMHSVISDRKFEEFLGFSGKLWWGLKFSLNAQSRNEIFRTVARSIKLYCSRKLCLLYLCITGSWYRVIAIVICNKLCPVEKKMC